MRRENEGFERYHGGKGFGERNAEGVSVLEFAQEFDLILTNTTFTKRSEHLVTYKSGNNQSQIDYILVRRESRAEVTNCKAIAGEPVVTQHRLLVSDLVVKRKKKRQTHRRGTTQVWKLSEHEVATNFKAEVLQIKNVCEAVRTAEESWNQMKKILLDEVVKTCGRKKSRKPMNTDSWWWSAEVQESIEKGKEAYKSMTRNSDLSTISEYKKCKRETKRAVAKARARASERLYEKLDTKEGEKKKFRIARARNHAKRDVSDAVGIMDRDCNLVYDDEQVCERWKEYFEELLNKENDREALQEASKVEGPEKPIDRKEVETALKAMKRGKAAGFTELTTEVSKALENDGVEWISEVLSMVWDEEKIPSDWEWSYVVRIFKGKGSSADCGNYRGIKVLEHCMKIYGRILDKRLREQIELHESQCGFMPGKGTVDPLFIMRQRQKKALEGNQKMYIAFVDLEKAYDRFPRDLVLWCLRKRGITEKMVRVVASLYHHCVITIWCGAGESMPFKIKVGLHQGSALSPFLFAVVIDTISASSQRGLPKEMLYADDLAITADTKEELQERLCEWQIALESKGMKVNSRKTEVMVSSRSESEEINVKDNHQQKLNQVAKFSYLGSIIEKQGGCSEEIRVRIQKAWAKWRDDSGVVCDKHLPRKIKSKVYRSIIRPVLLYGLEVLALKTVDEKLLENTEMKMMRWIGGISLRQHRTNDDIRRLLGVTKITENAREARLRWLGHVMRREQEHVLRRVCDVPVEGKRNRDKDCDCGPTRPELDEGRKKKKKKQSIFCFGLGFKIISSISAAFNTFL